MIVMRLNRLMNLNRNEKLMLKKYLNSIIVCICSFIENEKVKECIDKVSSCPELISLIAEIIKEKEFSGWMGEDLKEDQLNVLTIISELYLKRNKSKYKTIEKPSELLMWFSLLIKESFLKTELRINKSIDDLEAY